ncbi:MAG: nucleotidyltransferase family protein [Clostridia bacterium]|nr:nucleotidyltransferase family protein [Clostridia bacterium]
MKNLDIEKLFIKPDTTLKNTMEVIEKNAKGIALVIDHNERLLGTITDGDIRRAILKGIHLDEAIKSIMNEHFIFLTPGFTNTLVQTIYQQKSINQLPVLDDNMRVIDIVFVSDLYQKSSKENWAVIMAGGLGTRLYPLTKDIPKPMLTVGAKPIIETIIEQLKSYGYTNIILSLNYKAEIIKNYFQDGSNFGVNIKYISEKKRMGTAGAIRLAEQYLDKPFFVINGDILTRLNFEQFMKYHVRNDNIITIGTKKYDMQIPYGVVSITDENVVELKEKPCMNFFINGGMYCLNPDAIEFIPEDEYFDITQLINIYLEKKKKIGSFPITEYWMDIGQIDDYNQANMDYDNQFRGEISAAKE